MSAIAQELTGRKLMQRAPKRDGSIIALLQARWEDFTGICDVSSDGAEEYRLMRCPAGNLYIVVERLIASTGEWSTTAKPVSQDEAWSFYISNVAPPIFGDRRATDLERRLAYTTAKEDIRSMCLTVKMGEEIWWDTTPNNPSEGRWIAEAVEYLESRHLLIRDDKKNSLVRVLAFS